MSLCFGVLKKKYFKILTTEGSRNFTIQQMKLGFAARHINQGLNQFRTILVEMSLKLSVAKRVLMIPKTFIPARLPKLSSQ